MRKLFLVGALALLTAACASQTPQTTAGIADRNVMRPGPDSNTLVFRAPNIDVRKYRGLYIEPVIIYAGADADFDGATSEEKQEIADIIYLEFTKALEKKYHFVAKPGPNNVIIRLTLAGITKTRPLLSAAVRLSPVGAGITILKSIAGKPATFTGSVVIGGELIDANNGQALGGFISKESPAAFDITSALGTLEAARLGARKGATDFAAALDRLTGR